MSSQRQQKASLHLTQKSREARHLHCKRSYPMLQSITRVRCSLYHIRRFTTSTETAFIALGSNLGNRANNIHKALKELEKHVTIHQTSFLYESKPMYITDQPSFLNAALQIETKHSPHELLKRLKSIESALGREGGVRNGPRPIDLDILTYGSYKLQDEQLTIPHPRIHEREFVLRPLCDIDPSLRISSTSAETLLENVSTDGGLIRVTPMRSGRLLKWGERTLFMGIINATPDSFSDGGLHNTIDAATKQVSKFLKSGFDIIDIGGQSTRPGATTITREEELRRVIPIIEAVVRAFPEAVVSCDTYDPFVAARALAAGADMINDVSGGRGGVHEVVEGRHAAFVLMHMRGTPETMCKKAVYENVLQEVVEELGGCVAAALRTGIPRWSIMTDPGIGFAKTASQSVELIKEMRLFKSLIGGYPTVLGLSRKSFMCERGEEVLIQDLKTCGAGAVAVAQGGVDVLRIHDTSVLQGIRAGELVTRHRYERL